MDEKYKNCFIHSMQACWKMAEIANQLFFIKIKFGMLFYYYGEKLHLLFTKQLYVKI